MCRFSLAIAVAGLVAALAPVRAHAQSSLPLLLEAARDPGPADVPLTARTLALGGARGDSGRAEDALANPAALSRGPAREFQFSAGRFAFGRDELTLTPKQLPPFQPSRTPSASSIAPGVFAAAAFRGARAAGAAFVDAGTHLAHEFTTADNSLTVSAIPGTLLETRASGAASVDTAVTRAGGALAVSTRNHRASAGAAVYLAHLGGRIDGRIDVDDHAIHYAPFTPSDTHVFYREENFVSLASWGMGFVVSGAVRPIEAVTIGARWTSDQPFSAERVVTSTRAGSVIVPPAPVEWRLPSVFAVSMTALTKRSTFVVELTRTRYSEVYGPAPGPISDTSFCQTLSVSTCEGWGFGHYVAADATGLRFGFEQGLESGRFVNYLRSGFSVQQPYTLARAAGDRTIDALQEPGPLVPTPFTPPRQTPWTWSVGWAIASGPVEVGAGLAIGPRQHRFLVDVRALRF